MTKTRTQPRFANNEFIAACLKCDELLAKLTALRNEHFYADPEAERDWGEVGSVNYLNEKLREALAHYSQS